MGEKEIEIGSGVIQGGVISGTLFLIAYNNLLERLKETNMDVAAYADDLVIV